MKNVLRPDMPMNHCHCQDFKSAANKAGERTLISVFVIVNILG